MKAEKIEELAKRRGLFWQASEIYGGLSGFYDWGHIGTLIKRKMENLWRQFFIDNESSFEIETTHIMPEQVFIASDHINNFIDPVTKCKKCGTIHRADHIIGEYLKENFEGLKPEKLSALIKKYNIRCPACKGPLTDAGTLNMMFPLKIGPYEGTKAFLRPETAQGAYINFKRIYDHLRKKLPIGLAIIGKAYRNEISPRNLLLRQREFTQAELQIFFDPKMEYKLDNLSDYKLRLFSVADRKSNTIKEMSCADIVKKLHLPEFYVLHLAKVQKFYLDILAIPKEKFRFRELSDEERSFYSKIHWDIELLIENQFKEIGGLHYRTDYDLSGHQKVSKHDMSINADGRKFIPHVLELSFGIDRIIYAIIDIFYTEELVKGEKRVLLKLPPVLSPFDAGLFPLVAKDGLPEKSLEIKKLLQDKGFSIFYDSSGSIGRRYRRADEIGIAKCITIDYQTLQDNTVTIRDRDSMAQIRVRIDDLEKKLKYAKS
jgi:glycyl-tRNA synthetase